MKKRSDIKKRAGAKQQVEPKRPAVTAEGKLAWWQELMPWAILVVVLIWGASLVTLTVRDALNPPTSQELLQK